MVLFFVKDKLNCAKCHKKFFNHFCKICKRREYGLCWNCHKHDKAHKAELRNV